MECEPAYPVIFTETGDEVRDAIRKHIQEIERIYELLDDVSIKVGNVIIK